MKITSEAQQKIKLETEQPLIIEFYINTQENLFVNSKDENKPIGIIWPLWVGKYFYPKLEIDFINSVQLEKYQNIKNKFEQKPLTFYTLEVDYNNYSTEAIQELFSNFNHFKTSISKTEKPFELLNDMIVNKNKYIGVFPFIEFLELTAIHNQTIENEKIPILKDLIKYEHIDIHHTREEEYDKEVDTWRDEESSFFFLKYNENHPFSKIPEPTLLYNDKDKSSEVKLPNQIGFKFWKPDDNSSKLEVEELFEVKDNYITPEETIFSGIKLNQRELELIKKLQFLQNEFYDLSFKIKNKEEINSTLKKLNSTIIEIFNDFNHPIRDKYDEYQTLKKSKLNFLSFLWNKIMDLNIHRRLKLNLIKRTYNDDLSIETEYEDEQFNKIKFYLTISPLRQEEQIICKSNLKIEIFNSNITSPTIYNFNSDAENSLPKSKKMKI